MSRIVDKDLLISGMVDGLLDLPGKTYRAVREYIEGFPEAVTHAHWIDCKHGMKKCSKCKSYPPEDYSGYSIECEYCPHCGARMDEEGECG